jgi:hypothetical protein
MFLEIPLAPKPVPGPSGPAWGHGPEAQQDRPADQQERGKRMVDSLGGGFSK